MNRPREYTDVMASKSDDELYDVLSHENDFNPEALEAVRQELAKRKLEPSRISELQLNADERIKNAAAISQMPLQWSLRILMFLFPFGIAQALLAESYRNRGYGRKSKEVWSWMKYGLVFYLALIIISKLLPRLLA